MLAFFFSYKLCFANFTNCFLKLTANFDFVQQYVTLIMSFSANNIINIEVFQEKKMLEIQKQEYGTSS